MRVVVVVVVTEFKMEREVDCWGRGRGARVVRCRRGRVYEGSRILLGREFASAKSYLHRERWGWSGSVVICGLVVASGIKSILSCVGAALARSEVHEEGLVGRRNEIIK
jgi:hypothetical protein